ncbi:MAG: SAM-dependent methyltransferase [Dorea sp.]|nr:SAM-dependent methyltransferase [Dorea sp.]
MKKELEYTKQVKNDHLKAFGQYFTDDRVARFMCAWACENAQTMLDPAVGNSVFLKAARVLYPACEIYGYEIDETILNFFGNPADAKITNADYLLNDWDDRYDAIVCNPPYNRFQAISNRLDIQDVIFTHTGMKYSSYANLYTLFLLKSLYQLGENGRLAYIIPTEFLNSRYGTPIKEKLLSKRLIRAIINFQNNQDMFFHATTTCCILLLDHEPKDQIFFYNLQSVDQLECLSVGSPHENGLSVSYEAIKAEEKWRSYLYQEDSNHYQNLTEVGTFCKVTRGIATGANDFFCFHQTKLSKERLPKHAVIPCICRSKDVTNQFFTDEDFHALAQMDKPVYLLDIKELPKVTSGNASEAASQDALRKYIAYGEASGISQKRLLSIRKPWYSMEQRAIAPIWVSTACRNGLKFIRNLSGARTLTTFHSIYIRPGYEDYIDILFCYFLTPVAQEILRENRKELGNGLEKFQPNDLKTAKMLDLTLLSAEDCEIILEIFEKLKESQKTEKDPKAKKSPKAKEKQEAKGALASTELEQLDEIFKTYLTL